jgi:CBS domain containing-hemolysin-like protein
MARLYRYSRGIHCRPLPALLAGMSLSQAFDEFMRLRAHIMLVVDEYGGLKGLPPP